LRSVVLDGSASYSIGSGGDIDVARPSSIAGAQAADYSINIVGFAKYQQLKLSGVGGPLSVIWYNPSFPLGYIYPWPLTSETITLDLMIPLSEPANINADVAFPTEYDEAIKYNLAIRIAPEYGKEPSPTIYALAKSTLSAIESKNFSEQTEAVDLEIMKLANNRYDIDQG